MLSEVDIPVPTPPDVHLQVENDGDLVWFKPSEGPGPVFHIAADGTLTVYKLGSTHQELARLFWDAVMFEGRNYTQRLEGCEQIITTLSHDPLQEIIRDGEYEVFKRLKDEKAGVSMTSVRRVMEAIRYLCAMERN